MYRFWQRHCSCPTLVHAHYKSGGACRGQSWSFGRNPQNPGLALVMLTGRAQAMEGTIGYGEKGWFSPSLPTTSLCLALIDLYSTSLMIDPSRFGNIGNHSFVASLHPLRMYWGHDRLGSCFCLVISKKWTADRYALTIWCFKLNFSFTKYDTKYVVEPIDSVAGTTYSFALSR